MGGDCLNYGCVPSKALIASARHAHAMRTAGRFGLEAHDPKIDYSKIHQHVHGVIAAIAPNDSIERFSQLGVTIVQANAEFVNGRTVKAGDAEIRAHRYVIATGSSPLVPPIPGLDTIPYLTNETLFDLTRLPSHLIVVGAGPIGLEMAQAFCRLGSRVTVLEAETALSSDDREMTAPILDALRLEGVDLREGTKVTAVAKRGRYGVRVSVASKTEEEAIDGSSLLLAVGRKPNVENLGLDKARIAFGNAGIRVNRRLRTTNRRVYAVGDVAGGTKFTHWAGYTAGLVARSILFRMRARVNTDLATWVTFTDPEFAHVGLSDAEARRRHQTIRVLRWPFAENDRARTERQIKGQVRIITTKKGRILGVDIVGHNAGELIGIWNLAMAQNLDVKAMTGLLLPYPTMNEASRRAAITYFTPSLSNPWVRRLRRLLRRIR